MNGMSNVSLSPILPYTDRNDDACWQLALIPFRSLPRKVCSARRTPTYTPRAQWKVDTRRNRVNNIDVSDLPSDDHFSSPNDERREHCVLSPIASTHDLCEFGLTFCCECEYMVCFRVYFIVCVVYCGLDANIVRVSDQLGQDLFYAVADADGASLPSVRLVLANFSEYVLFSFSGKFVLERSGGEVGRE